MAEGAVETNSPRPRDAILQGRVEMHTARRPLSAACVGSGGDLRKEALNPSCASHRPNARTGPTLSSSSGRRSDVGELHQRGLDPEFRFEITFRRIGAGLANLGNTCFLNSVLQCLTYTEPFAAYLQSGKHKSSCHTAGFCAMCALQNHVMDALRSTGKILRPFHLVKNLRCISRNFRSSRQEDAHEYMVNLLESMHKCCLPSGIASESPNAYEKSLVHKIFGGHLRSQVKCLRCSYCSNKFDPFLDLSLEIMKADTLHKALSHFTAVEQLDGGERQYHCQQCKQKVRAVKQLTIHKAPYVLTVHLKRFDSILPGQKINKKVDFEPTLDLKRYVSDPCEGDLKYTLYGVLVHAGYATHSGHYYCFVRTSGGVWYSLNDDEVFQVSEKTVLQQKAYMLFYVRNLRSSVPRRALDIVCKEKRPAHASGSKESLHVYSLGSKKESQGSPGESGPVKAIQDCPREIGHKQYNAIPKTDSGSCGMPMPVKSTAVEEHLLKKASISMHDLAKDTQTSVLSEDYIFHSLSKVSPMEEASSTVSLLSSVIGKHLVAGGLVEKGSSKGSLNQLYGNDFLQSALCKEKSVCLVSSGFTRSASASDNLIAANPVVDNCIVSAESVQSSQVKTDVTANSTVGIDKSNMLIVHHAKHNTLLNLASNNLIAANTPVEDFIVAPLCGQSSHMKAGCSTVSTEDGTKSNMVVFSHDQVSAFLNPDPRKVPIEGSMSERHDPLKMKVQVDDTSCEAQGFLDHGLATLSNHSNAMSTPEFWRIAQVHCQVAAVDEGTANAAAVEVLENISRESGQVIPTKANLNTSCSSQSEGAGHTNFDKFIMKKKVRKHTHISNMKFGRGRLFLAYLNLVKKPVRKKKRRRIKKRHLNNEGNQMYGTLEDGMRGDQGTSTSTRVHAIDADLVLVTKRKSYKCLQKETGIDADALHSMKKSCHNSSGGGNRLCLVGDANIVDTDFLKAKYSDCGKRYVKSGAKTKFEGQHTIGEACAQHNSPHHIPRNLLTSSSGEMTVAQWNNRGSMPRVASTSDDKPKSIGYMLSEREKECDQGKKVKRSRKFFGGGNHFRDIAIRAQKKMKMDQTSSGNRPFRIHS